MRILFFLVALLFFIFQAAPAYSQGDADTLACRQNRGSCSFIACSGSLVDIGTCRGGKLKCCKCMSLVPGQNQLMLKLCPY